MIKHYLKKQINESCKQGIVQNKKLFTNCKRYGHTIDNCIKRKIFTTTINTDKCPLCNDTILFRVQDLSIKSNFNMPQMRRKRIYF